MARKRGPIRPTGTRTRVPPFVQAFNRLSEKEQEKLIEQFKERQRKKDEARKQRMATPEGRKAESKELILRRPIKPKSAAAGRRGKKR